jgi:hypothetical protein
VYPERNVTGRAVGKPASGPLYPHLNPFREVVPCRAVPPLLGARCEVSVQHDDAAGGLLPALTAMAGTLKLVNFNRLIPFLCEEENA